MNASPYRDAAVLYFEAGWPGPLPLPANAKRDPPTGFTGANGAFPSRADIQAWCDNGKGSNNIALRLPDDVIGIDVDMYDGKQGRETLATLEARWGPLPDTWMSSSRDDGSGIRFYRVPAGRKWPSVLPPDIEIIQHGHRYAVVWPSVHPNGAQYRWTTLDRLHGTAGNVPAPEALTELPARWLDGLATFTSTVNGSGWTDPDLDALVEHGIPAGVNQDEKLRDVVWTMRRDGYAHHAARSTWRDITKATTLTDPAWPWKDSDFERHWKGADAKLPRPLTELAPSRPTTDEEAGNVSNPMYVDIAMLLAEGLPPPPAPTVLRRADGVALFYAEKVNVLFGDPECGKTWIAYAAVVEALSGDTRAAVIDTDHNGATDIVTRLINMGVDPVKLRDRERFRLAEPEDKTELGSVVADLRTWLTYGSPCIVDSVGEILPMLGLSSNSPDDYTAAHRLVLTSLARSGAAVIAIDHLPKADEARAHGQTGTVAKRRAVGGISLRVTLREVFTPGRGGSAGLSIHKDRPGGLRANCPVDGKFQPAGIFVMKDDLDGRIFCEVTTPTLSDRVAPDDDVAELDGLVPPPESVRDIKKRLGWGSDRATPALRDWRKKCP